MDITKTTLQQLHPLELTILLGFFKDDIFSTHMLVAKKNMVLGQANQAISWLATKHLIKEHSRKLQVLYEHTELGNTWKSQGTPLERLFISVSETPLSFVEIINKTQLEQSDVGSAYGTLSKEGLLAMNKEKQIFQVEEKKISQSPTTCILQRLLSLDSPLAESDLNKEEIAIISQYAKKRGSAASPFRKIEREIVDYNLTSEGIKWANAARSANLTGDEIGALTPAMLKHKTWKSKTFRAYNITLPPNKVSIGRENSYANFLRQVKNKLIALGFEEFDGSLVETEFWNSDALFMPQFHPARNIHDVYYIENPTHAKEIKEPYLSNVSQVHKNGGNTKSRGWRYSFDKTFTRRLILRSQGTVMSAKTLPNAKIPGKYFGILRVFRHDQIDATHLSDFYQTEGIILGEDVNIPMLLGLLKTFAEEFVHAEEVRYVPGYFPFTEPSIEVHIKHPQIGWMELGGSGIFRPEVTEPLGIHVPVAAWGIGIDRMATLQMDIKDLRDLFSYDLEKVSLQKRVII